MHRGVQRKAGRVALMLEPPWRLIPSEINKLGTRAGTRKKVSALPLVKMSLLMRYYLNLMHVRARNPSPSPSCHSITQKREGGGKDSLCTSPTNKQSSPSEQQTRAANARKLDSSRTGQVGFSSVSQLSPGPCLTLAWSCPGAPESIKKPKRQSHLCPRAVRLFETVAGSKLGPLCLLCGLPRSTLSFLSFFFLAPRLPKAKF